MKFISQIINRFNDLIGQTISWMALVLVLLIVVDVFLRYVFQFSSPAVFELEWHLFAALFLLGAGWTFKNDQHVRVDLFYQKFSEKGKAVVNLFGTLILLLPFCVVGFIESFDFALNSFKIGETSPDPGGLPARYIIKSCIPVSFLLLGLQGLSTILTSTLALTQK